MNNKQVLCLLVFCILFHESYQIGGMKLEKNTRASTPTPTRTPTPTPEPTPDPRIPHSYIMETTVPESSVIEVFETHFLRIWPKDKDGKNTTVELAQIRVIIEPIEKFDIARVDEFDLFCVTVQFKVLEPVNPAGIQVLSGEGKDVEGSPRIFAVISDGVLSGSKSTVEVNTNDTTIEEFIYLNLEFNDQFGAPAKIGLNDFEISSSSVDKLMLIGKDAAKENQRLFIVTAKEVGEYDLTVKYKGEEFQGSPVRLKFYTKPNLDPKQTIAIGHGAWLTPNGKTSSIHFQLYAPSGDVYFPLSEKQKVDDINSNLEISVEEKELLLKKTLNEHMNINLQFSYVLPNKTAVILKERKENIEELQFDEFVYTYQYFGTGKLSINYIIALSKAAELTLSISKGDLQITEKPFTITVQEGYFPLPPLEYSVLAPIPAKQRLIDVDHANYLGLIDTYSRNVLLNHDGYFFYNATRTDEHIDLQSMAEGKFSVEEEGSFLLYCNGVENYKLSNSKETFSGGIMNKHELSVGNYSIIVYLQSKQSNNFEFICAFSKYKPLVIYPQQIIPDILSLEQIGSIIIQSHHNEEIKDINISILSTNAKDNLQIELLHSKNNILPGQIQALDLLFSFKEMPVEDVYANIVVYSKEFKIAKTTNIFLQLFKETEKNYVKYTYFDFDDSIQIAYAKPPSVPCSGLCKTVVFVKSKFSDPVEIFNQYQEIIDSAWMLIPKGRNPIPFEYTLQDELHITKAIQSLFEFTNIYFKNLKIDVFSSIFINANYGTGKTILQLASNLPEITQGFIANGGWLSRDLPANEFCDPFLYSIIHPSSNHLFMSKNINGYSGLVLLNEINLREEYFPTKFIYSNWIFNKNGLKLEKYNDVSSIDYFNFPERILPPTSDVIHYIQSVLSTKKNETSVDFSFSTVNSHEASSRGGVKILSKISPLLPAEIQVKNPLNDPSNESDDIKMVIHTTNVNTLLVTRARYAISDIIVIDDFLVDFPQTETQIRFCKSVGGNWKACTRKNAPLRRSSHFGPANRIFSDEIVIVYGTNDKKFEEVEKKVAIFIANELFKTNELSVKIISDKEFINNAANPDVYPGNLIIIGGSITNALANRVINQEFMTVDISKERGHFSLGNCLFTNKSSIAFGFLAPVEHRLALVVAGSNYDSFYRLVQVLPLHPPYDAFPDYVVIQRDSEIFGPHSILSAGYWDENWQWKRETSYSTCARHKIVEENFELMW